MASEQTEFRQESLADQVADMAVYFLPIHPGPGCDFSGHRLKAHADGL